MEEKTANFLFSKVEDMGFELHPKPENFELKIPSKEIKIGILGKPTPDTDKDEFILDLKIVIEFAHEGEDPIPLINYHFSSTFKFYTPLSSLVTFSDKETFNFPENIMAAIVGTAYSTARGLLISKLSNSYLKEFVLPMVSVMGLMKQIFPGNETKEASKKPTKNVSSKRKPVKKD